MSDIVFASYYTATQDPQRHTFWENDTTDLLPLINSVTSQNIKIIIFHDCFTSTPSIELCEWVYCKPNTLYVPTIVRWFNYLNYLTNCEVLPSRIFMVDSTDVEMLKNPFLHILPNKLYCGSEYDNTISHPYINNKKKYFNISDYSVIMNNESDHMLLNCGICGGYTESIIRFLTQLTTYHAVYSRHITKVSLDMPIYNYTLLKHFKNIIEYGSHINTMFKQFETNNTTAWWKHK